MRESCATRNTLKLLCASHEQWHVSQKLWNFNGVVFAPSWFQLILKHSFCPDVTCSKPIATRPCASHAQTRRRHRQPTFLFNCYICDVFGSVCKLMAWQIITSEIPSCNCRPFHLHQPFASHAFAMRKPWAIRAHTHRHIFSQILLQRCSSRLDCRQTDANSSYQEPIEHAISCLCVNDKWFFQYRLAVLGPFAYAPTMNQPCAKHAAKMS